MKTVTLENGNKVRISDESHDALEKASKKRCKPEYGGWYWVIDSCGSIKLSDWGDSKCDNFRYQNHNVFPSEGDAQAALDRLNKRNEILNRIEELNEGWEPDWESFERKYCIHNWEDDTNFSIDHHISLRDHPSEYFFKSKEIGYQLLKDFGDDLKVLFV